VANGAFHKGMPHKYYHGRTGVVWNVTPRAVGVELLKRVKHRYVKKRIHVRVEHVKPSKCMDDFIKRRAENDKKRREIKDPKVRGSLKRSPGWPREAFWVNPGKQGIETVTPQRYALII
jgi:large subunit ribosomal protein L21e